MAIESFPVHVVATLFLFLIAREINAASMYPTYALAKSRLACSLRCVLLSPLYCLKPHEMSSVLLISTDNGLAANHLPLLITLAFQLANGIHLPYHSSRLGSTN